MAVPRVPHTTTATTTTPLSCYRVVRIIGEAAFCGEIIVSVTITRKPSDGR